MEPDEQIRLFCALRLPDEVVAALAGWQRRYLSAGRIVPPEHLHLTTAFLGRRPAGDLDAVAVAVAAADAFGPLRFRVLRYRETRSVGMLVLDDEGGRGAAYAGRLHALLREQGLYEPESRPWLPHVTVLRFRERPRLRPPLPELPGIAPSDAAVYLSRLSPSGARYEVLRSFGLGG